jgi:hypothetical protein
MRHRATGQIYWFLKIVFVLSAVKKISMRCRQPAGNIISGYRISKPETCVAAAYSGYVDKRNEVKPSVC